MSATGSAQLLSVSVNGEPRRIAPGATIAELLAQLGIDPDRVAVERNLQIIPRSTLTEVEVSDGDAFEVVHFVGGG